MRLRSCTIIFGIVFIAYTSCSNHDNSDDSSADTDSDSDGDSDADSDTDSDTDADSDSDGDVDTDGNCDAISPDADNYLWYDSYENDPWDLNWGLEWAQETNHEIVQTEVLFGERAAQVTYPKGTYSSEGGAQYRQRFDLLDPPIPKTDSMYVRYFVKFNEDIDFIKGGKLPGLIGGEGNTGGNPPDGYDGFSARIMWREKGRVVQYVYHIDQPTE